MAEGSGYGIYSGVQGMPYYVGMGGTGGQQAIDPNQKAPDAADYAAPTQAANTLGSYGAQSYQSEMPQWMQDYFDAQYGGKLGMGGLDVQRGLARNKLPELQQKYGMKAAANPYFTQLPQYGKGFDPLNNSVYINQSMEENPELQKYTSTQMDPFSGAQLGQTTSYARKQVQNHGVDSPYNSFGKFMLGK